MLLVQSTRQVHEDEAQGRGGGARASDCCSGGTLMARSTAKFLFNKGNSFNVRALISALTRSPKTLLAPPLIQGPLFISYKRTKFNSAHRRDLAVAETTTNFPFTTSRDRLQCQLKTKRKAFSCFFMKSVAPSRVQTQLQLALIRGSACALARITRHASCSCDRRVSLEALARCK